MKRAVPLATQLFLGVKPARPTLRGFHPLLEKFARRLAILIQRHGLAFKLASKWNREEIVKRQVVQARIADNAIYLFALTASLSKMDAQIRNGEYGPAHERDRAALAHLFDLFEIAFYKNLGELRHNADESMRSAAEAARRHNDTLPNEDYVIHEASPVAQGTGRSTPTEHIKQFPGDEFVGAGGDGAAVASEKTRVKPKPSSRRKKSPTDQGKR
jgi:hypothetical protein